MATFSRATTGDDVVQALSNQVKEKTVVITGASVGGLGAETALSLAKGNPAHLILLGRSANKIEPVIKQIKEINPNVQAKFVSIELDDFDSVRQAAQQINGVIQKLDILINNAGIMYVKEFQKNKKDIEIQFATNHLGHFVLTALLYPKIKAAGAGSRIVNLSSEGYKISPCRFEDYNFKDGQEYNAWAGYGQSKTANILFGRQLSSKLSGHGIQAYAVHPGVIFGTSLGTHVEEDDFKALDEASRKYSGERFVMEAPKSLQQGVSTTLVAALDPRIADQSGSYMVDCEVVPVRDYASSLENAQKLWDLSEKLTGERFEL